MNPDQPLPPPNEPYAEIFRQKFSACLLEFLKNAPSDDEKVFYALDVLACGVAIVLTGVLTHKEEAEDWFISRLCSNLERTEKLRDEYIKKS